MAVKKVNKYKGKKVYDNEEYFEINIAADV